MKSYLAEMVGTFVLVFGGVGSAVFSRERIGVLGVSLSFGLAVLVMVYTIGPISGCHINPAVTLAWLLHRRISARVALGYVIAQILGAVVAASFILLIARGAPGGYDPRIAGLGANGFGLHSPGHHSLVSAFVTELILTFFLVFTVLSATAIKTLPGFAGIVIGLALTLVNLVGIPITNASANPARSIGPAVLVGGWAFEQLWLFIVAPLVGAALAAAAYWVVSATIRVVTLVEVERLLSNQEIRHDKRGKAA